MINLKYLEEWTDFDIALYELSIEFGLIKIDQTQDRYDFFRRHKHLFWSNNVFCNSLTEIIYNFAKIGLLEINDDQQVRVNKEFLAIHFDSEYIGK